ncbi:MAG: translation initiation factor IF-2 [Gemmatimonadetes bacterium]|nr:translation initiation factor IF-2 [Gemmatimonadota bacterium]MYG22292.1 translation initiation factor IF-2 [Gemmatimonadota bacterium]MYJ39201.1 translation initiation factor IF-2 [Gemmatimonadota bacterium]
MRVRELAVDLKVGTDVLLRFLRKSGVAVGHADAPIRAADVARVRMRLERERRAGRGNAAEVMRDAVKGSRPKSRRRRVRRRRTAPAPSPSAVEEVTATGDLDTAGELRATELPVADAETLTETVAASDTSLLATTGRREGRPAAQEEAVSAASETPGDLATSAELVGESADGDGLSPETSPDSEATPDGPQPGQDETGEFPSATAAADGSLPAVAEHTLDAAATEPAADSAAEAAPATPTPAESDLPGVPPETRPDRAAEGQPPTPVAEGLTPARRGLPPAPAREGLPLQAGERPAPAASAGPGGTVRIQAEGYTSDGRRKKARKKGKRRRAVGREEARQNIQRVMAEIKSGRKKRRKGKASLAAAREERVAAEQQAARKSAAEARTIRVNEFLTVAELAELIDISPAEIIGSAFKDMGLPVTINQRLDFDQIELLLDGFGFKAVRETDYLPTEEVADVDDPADLRARPPVVTVMGHVDHGKTRLLDWIRNTNVVAGEAGGITQHIGAYHVELDDGRAISFLDTPGHAAFTAMRARGADVTDLVVLVVAADDAVMPQTIEAVSHARNAGVPMVVAINKIDLPTSDADRVKQELLRQQVTVEDYGGDTLVAEVSAKTGQGMDDLLEKILLQAELLELKANPFRDAIGAVVEAELDIGKGPVATILVQNGTLRVGDSYVAGLYSGRVRALLDERGNHVEEVGPGSPVQIVGTTGVPQAGDVLQVMDHVQATSIATTRQRLDREKQLRIRERGIKLGDFSKLLATGEVNTLRLVVKGDVDGSVQAVCDAMEQLSTSEVRVEIIHRGVGAINESDVMLALTAGAVVIGFRVRPDAGARQASAREAIEIQIFDIIYEAVDSVRAALEGLLAPERREKIMGAAEVRVVFKIRGVGTIAGSYVVDGQIQRGVQARVIRDGVVAYEGEVASLRRFKDDVREVRDGFECGIGISNFNDLKTGDIIETFSVEEVARTLAGVSGS